MLGQLCPAQFRPSHFWKHKHTFSHMWGRNVEWRPGVAVQSILSVGMDGKANLPDTLMVLEVPKHPWPHQSNWKAPKRLELPRCETCGAMTGTPLVLQGCRKAPTWGGGG